MARFDTSLIAQALQARARNAAALGQGIGTGIGTGLANVLKFQHEKQQEEKKLQAIQDERRFKGAFELFKAGKDVNFPASWKIFVEMTRPEFGDKLEGIDILGNEKELDKAFTKLWTQFEKDEKTNPGIAKGKLKHGINLASETMPQTREKLIKRVEGMRRIEKAITTPIAQLERQEEVQQRESAINTLLQDVDLPDPGQSSPANQAVLDQRRAELNSLSTEQLQKAVQQRELPEPEKPLERIREEAEAKELGKFEAVKEIGAKQAPAVINLMSALGGSTEMTTAALRTMRRGIPVSRIESLISTFEGISARKRREKFDEDALKSKQSEDVLKRDAAKTKTDLERARLANSINSTYQNNSDVRRFTAMEQATRSMNALIDQEPLTTNKSAIQLAMITLFNKVTDPLSVVRESEFERTPTAVSMINRLEGSLTKLYAGGAGITKEDLDALVFAANIIRNEAAKSYNKATQRFRGIGALGGVQGALIGAGEAEPLPLGVPETTGGTLNLNNFRRQ
jgi:hypothetical protein